ncbi:major facilitator superfamily transporter monocarboxylate [Grosmannia clavigera kw1407]|uniref:Major facilitator superfamily transporter monocarboxylate n=1 Tax=Grosmannia clavigera (strain kw1407 / UAMH 11150) TaxID=655863 RepID=F0XV25_GROCL|nr:major facilitator superfamily transporter monocarboxylate [Grosmannia clavigera kw1407]EFW98538.1 major facilitator superfamily transporter monocarboxylate [Grosmannia clavigera kw1407]
MDPEHTPVEDSTGSSSREDGQPVGDVEKAAVGFEPAPDGGLLAWSVAAGGFFVVFSTLGFANSFGVFEEFYMTHQLAEKSADTISWIGSCSTFFQYLAGAVSGPLFDRYGAMVLHLSAFCCVFAVMMISLCKQYYQFFLAQGVLLGLASGGMQFPAMAAAMQYFDRKRGAALGIIIAGSSLGGVVFPVALSRMLNTPAEEARLGFGWAVRIIGFIMLGSLVVSCLTVRPRLPPRKTSFFLVGAWRQNDFRLLVASFFSFLGMMMPLFYLPSFAVSIGTHATLASYLLAIVNGASTFGRIIPGILADRLGRINVLVVGCTTTGICIFCMTTITSNAGLVVFAIFFGFTSGTIISGISVALSICVADPRNMGTYMGMGMGLSSIAALVGPPINGRLVHAYGGYLQTSIFSGVTCLVGAALAFLAKAGTPAGLWGRT